MPRFKLKVIRSSLIFQVIVSFFALIFPILLSLHPVTSQESFVPRKPLVGTIFAVVCAVGILAVFFPKECQKPFAPASGRQNKDRFFSFNRNVSGAEDCVGALHGHHPICGIFSSHVFHLNNKVFCATCSGLFLGAIISLFGVMFYFFGNWQSEHAFPLVLVGTLAVGIGLLQVPLLKVQRSSIRVFSSASLAAGSFLILVGLDELIHSVLLDSFFILLTVFWLVTRISLSQWEHERMCSKCSLTSCRTIESNKK